VLSCTQLQHAHTFETTALAHLPDDEPHHTPAAALEVANSGAEGAARCLRTFVGSRLRLLHSVWAAEIKMHGDSHMRVSDQQGLLK